MKMKLIALTAVTGIMLCTTVALVPNVAHAGGEYRFTTSPGTTVRVPQAQYSGTVTILLRAANRGPDGNVGIVECPGGGRMAQGSIVPNTRSTDASGRWDGVTYGATITPGTGAESNGRMYDIYVVARSNIPLSIVGVVWGRP